MAEPTEAELKAAGYALPQGNDMIRGGDDAIRQNAAAAYKQAWYRGVAPDGTDWNTTHGLDNDGVWDIASHASARTMAGLPDIGYTGQMQVLAASGGHSTQIYTPQGTGARIWIRFTTGGPGTWGAWSDLTNPNITTRLVPDNFDLTDVSPAVRLPAGFWSVKSAASAATINGLPEGVGACVFQQWPYNPAAAPAARLLIGANNTGVWYQTLDGTNNWASWIRVDSTAGTGAGGPQPAIALTDRILASKGGRIGTAGRGVVAIRIDHNMRAMTDIVLPLLAERGIPASQCHFVEEMTPQPHYSGDDSTGSTWADVQAQALDHGIEVWSHGWTHTDRSGDGLTQEIVDSRVELETQIPRVPVTGFIVPGVNGSKWEGFSDKLSDARVWNTTTAGSLIAANYGTADGHGSILNPLTGRPNFGWTSYFIDSVASASSVASLVDAAKDTATGLVLAIHPRVIGMSGQITEATLTEILDYIAAERDAGRIDVLTVSGLLCADPYIDRRHNMLRTPDFSNTVNWSGTSGWSFAGNEGTAQAGAGVLTQTHSVGRTSWVAGSVREALLDITAEAPATVRVSVSDDAGQTVSETVDHPGDRSIHTVRRPFTIPKDAVTITYRVEVMDGTATIKNPGLNAL